MVSCTFGAMVGVAVGAFVTSGAGVTLTTFCASGSSPPKPQPAIKTDADIVTAKQQVIFCSSYDPPKKL